MGESKSRHCCHDCCHAAACTRGAQVADTQSTHAQYKNTADSRTRHPRTGRRHTRAAQQVGVRACRTHCCTECSPRCTARRDRSVQRLASSRSELRSGCVRGAVVGHRAAPSAASTRIRADDLHRHAAATCCRRLRGRACRITRRTTPNAADRGASPPKRQQRGGWRRISCLPEADGPILHAQSRQRCVEYYGRRGRNVRCCAALGWLQHNRPGGQARSSRRSAVALLQPECSGLDPYQVCAQLHGVALLLYPQQPAGCALQWATSAGAAAVATATRHCCRVCLWQGGVPHLPHPSAGSLTGTGRQPAAICRRATTFEL